VKAEFMAPQGCPEESDARHEYAYIPVNLAIGSAHSRCNVGSRLWQESWTVRS
jgi:hypothetical protein